MCGHWKREERERWIHSQCSAVVYKYLHIYVGAKVLANPNLATTAPTSYIDVILSATATRLERYVTIEQEGTY